MQPAIALLTDFGLADIYVGVMKGVMLGICPSARLIDITHAIEPQNVRQGAFALLNAYRYFPTGTVFLAVVDPGVGSARRAIVAEAGGYRFVAPDNGVISYALHELGDAAAYELTDPRYRLAEVSNTFHGRDIFAPAAAHLAAGVSVSDFGPVAADLVRLPQPLLDATEGRVTGEIVHVDHFGNLVTSIGQMRWLSPQALELTPRLASGARSVAVAADQTRVRIGERDLSGIRRNYSEAARGELLAMVGSNGYLEIAVSQGSAAAETGARPGDRVEMRSG